MAKQRAPEMTDEEAQQYRKLLRTHPGQYARIANETIEAYPDDPEGYWDHAHYAIEMEWFDYALSDLTKALALDRDPVIRFTRATVLLRLGRYHEALAEFDQCGRQGERMYNTIMHACRATCHAYLGDPEAALAACAKMRDDHFLPDIFGQFGGTKAHVTEAARRIASQGRQG
jgi:tetratricopeptide (TPR) repeat protein